MTSRRRRRRGEIVYLHVGGARSLDGRDIILILDPLLGERSDVIREWIGALRAQGRVEETSAEPVRSWVVTDERVWCAPVTPATLVTRSKKPWS